MLASVPASMLNQNTSDLGILNRIDLKTSRFSEGVQLQGTVAPMSILTNRELEFLASLNTRWRRLYWNELAFLLSENRTDRPAERFRFSNGLDAAAQVKAQDRVKIVMD